MLKDKILEYLKQRSPKLDTEGFESLPIFSVLDSMEFLELLGLLEEELEIELDLSEVDPEEFNTLGKFCAIIESLKESK